jgi:subtilisin family serine protease
MKNKIIGISICMLMVLTAFSAVATTTKQEKSTLVLSTVTPNDPGFNKQYYLQTTSRLMFAKINLFGKIPFLVPFLVKPDTDIDAPEAWAIETGSPDVVIAFIDSGVDYTHPDLKANIWNNTDEIPNNSIDDDGNGYIDDVMGWNFVKNNNDVKDDNGFGTYYAGIAAAVGNNSIGIAGVAWNCKIMPVKVINETGSSYWEDIAAGIRYAADNNADVICMNPGDFSAPQIMEDAVNYAYGKGVFLCAGAGYLQNGTNAPWYPAAYDNVTAVGFTWSTNRAHFESNYGDWVDIAAPGVVIYSTMPTYHVYENWRYTKNYSWMGAWITTAPQVAGAAALLKSKDPSLTPAEIKTLLCNNTDPYTGSHYIGTGRLNAYKALSALTR